MSLVLFTVIIPLPPSITDPPRPVTTTISTVVNLTCLVTGSPDPLIAWFKDGEQIANARLQYYYIPSVTPDDRGNYRCTASNEIDVATSAEALLQLSGVREYLVGLALSGRERRKRQNELEMVCLLTRFAQLSQVTALIVGPHSY